MNANQELPSQVAFYERQWREYISARKAEEATLAKLSQEEIAEFGLTENETIYRQGQGPDAAAVASAMVFRLAELIVKMNLPQGLSLSLHKLDLASVLPDTNWWRFDADKFSPNTIWGQLKAVYGGGKAIQAACRQAAERLVSSFRVYTSGGIALSETGHATFTTLMRNSGLCRGRTENRRVLPAGVDTEMAVTGPMSALNAMLYAQGGDVAIAADLAAVETFLKDIAFKEGFVSRSTVGGQHVQLSLYFNKAVFHLSNAVVTRINNFIVAQKVLATPSDETSIAACG